MKSSLALEVSPNKTHITKQPILLWDWKKKKPAWFLPLLYFCLVPLTTEFISLIVSPVCTKKTIPHSQRCCQIYGCEVTANTNGHNMRQLSFYELNDEVRNNSINHSLWENRRYTMSPRLIFVFIEKSQSASSSPRGTMLEQLSSLI